MTTYVICPGRIVSETDGQFHHIDALQLARLYGLKPGQYIVRPERAFGRFGWRSPGDAVHLHPRDDGNYTLPDQVNKVNNGET